MTTKTRGPRKTAAKKKAPPKRRTRNAPPADELAGAQPTRQQCSAQTAKGGRCKRLAVDGAELCAVHLGAPVGRPVKLTDSVTNRICEIIRAGGYVETAAAVAGISKATYHDWIKRGDPAGVKAADAPFRDFRDKVEQAKAEGEATLVTRLAIAAQKDWKAAAWMLERQYPDRWAGPRGRAIMRPGDPDDPPGGGALTDPDGQPVVIDDQAGPDGKPL